MTRAVSMTRYGGPDVLVCGRVASPSPGAGDIVIRTIAAAVNHTDLEIRAGNWPIRRAAPFPYVPGVEVLGEVEALGAAVNDLRPGQRVITMMQGLGGVRAERAGGYAERVVVPAETVACLPDRLDPLGFAAVGLAGVTAHAGLRRMGALGGKRILITGAAGASARRRSVSRGRWGLRSPPSSRARNRPTLPAASEPRR
ncbi:MAG: alcohol dehydrogenase catalytic domain-containing protein [Tabrizicola sp.]|nr:alcohol dehydrogenase catalytic domain-containing protein [Tabrizicola sp.]